MIQPITRSDRDKSKTKTTVELWWRSICANMLCHVAMWSRMLILHMVMPLINGQSDMVIFSFIFMVMAK